MNLQFVHYAALVCAALAAGLPQLEEAIPEAALFLKAAAAFCALLAGVLAVLSPSALSGGDAKKEEK